LTCNPYSPARGRHGRSVLSPAPRSFLFTRVEFFILASRSFDHPQVVFHCRKHSRSTTGRLGQTLHVHHDYSFRPSNNSYILLTIAPTTAYYYESAHINPTYGTTSMKAFLYRCCCCCVGAQKCFEQNFSNISVPLMPHTCFDIQVRQ
jgi:hypothetical protein